MLHRIPERMHKKFKHQHILTPLKSHEKSPKRTHINDVVKINRSSQSLPFQPPNYSYFQELKKTPSINNELLSIEMILIIGCRLRGQFRRWNTCRGDATSFRKTVTQGEV